MIRFSSITIQNIMSYGAVPTTFNLAYDGVTGITGESGSGKTTIKHAIAFGLFGVLPDGLKACDFINSVNKRNGYVSIILRADDGWYNIERWLNHKVFNNSTRISFNTSMVFDDTHAIDVDDDYIEVLLGINSNMFMRTALISSNDMHFSHRTNSQRKNLLHEIMGLDHFKICAERLREQMIVSSNELKIIVAQNTIHRNAIATTAAVIDDLIKKEAVYNTDSSARVVSLLEDLGDIGMIDKPSEIAKINAAGAYSTAIAAADKRISVLVGEYTTIAASLQTLQTIISSLQQNKCPTCHQHWRDDAHYDDCALQLEIIHAKMDEVTTALQAAHDHRQSIACVEASQFSSIEELNAICDLRDVIERQITTINCGVNPYTLQLAEYNDIDITQPDNTTEANLVDLIKHQKFMYHMLTDKESFIIQAMIHDKLIYINSKIDEYLLALGIDHKITINASGDITTIHNRGVMNINTLSNGQRARVDLALSLAFHSLLLRDGSPLPICIMDEVLDTALDNVGVHRGMALIKATARETGAATFIITHRDEIKEAFDHTITINYDGIFSETI